MCEANKAFISGKLCVREHRGEFRVSCMEWKWQVTYVGAVICIVYGQPSCSCPYLVWLRALLDIYVHLAARMDSTARVSGKLAGHIMGWWPPPPLTHEDLLCSWVSVVILDHKNKKNCTSLWVAYVIVFKHYLKKIQGFPGGSLVKNPPANAGDAGSIPGLGRSPGEGNGKPL